MSKLNEGDEVWVPAVVARPADEDEFIELKVFGHSVYAADDSVVPTADMLRPRFRVGQGAKLRVNDSPCKVTRNFVSVAAELPSGATAMVDEDDLRPAPPAPTPDEVREAINCLRSRPMPAMDGGYSTALRTVTAFAEQQLGED